MVTFESEKVEERSKVMETDFFLSPQSRCKQLWRNHTNFNFDLEINITLWTSDLVCAYIASVLI